VGDEAVRLRTLHQAAQFLLRELGIDVQERDRVERAVPEPLKGVCARRGTDEVITTASPRRNTALPIAFEDATDGAEQPVYNSADGMFYVAIPELKKDAKKGGIAVIDPRKGTLVKILTVENCHPNGLTFGPNSNLALGCTASGKDEMPPITTIMNAKTGKVVKNVADIGGADMVAYNPKTDQYYTGSRLMPGGPVLGVIDAKTNALVQKVALKSGNPHSVAVNSANNHVFVPQSSKGGGCGCVLVFAPE